MLYLNFTHQPLYFLLPFYLTLTNVVFELKEMYTLHLFFCDLTLTNVVFELVELLPVL